LVINVSCNPERSSAGLINKGESMKFARTLGIVLAAALASMALIASSASASATLCTKDAAHIAAGASVCSAAHGSHVKIGSEIQAHLSTGTNAVLTVTNNSGGTVRTVECTTSTTGGPVTTTTAGGNITSLTFGGCTSAGCSNVSASAPRAGKSFPWASTATVTTAPNGQLHVTGPSGKFTATCLGITATCEYETSSATVTVTGGAPAVIHAESVPLELKSGVEFVCGTKADWKATYEITTPSSLYIT
jgi:hypothetical protein